MQQGVLVFLLGLFAGLAMVIRPGVFTNLRLALSAHLVGVSTGMFLMLAGLLLERARLSSRLATITFWCALYGAYGNFVATLLGAIFGTIALTAIAGAGYEGLPWQESLVSFLLTTSGTTMIAACVILLVGLSGNRPRD